jgi:PAS domain S-box-containing protein
VKNAPFIKAEDVTKKSAFVFLEGRLYEITGNWNWESPADRLFLSQVIFTHEIIELPAIQFLLHPDDLESVRKLVERAGEKKDCLFEFRVISSYGAISTVNTSGFFDCVEHDRFFDQIQQQQLQRFSAEQEKIEQLAEARQQIAGWTSAETITSSGVWFINSSNHIAFYSDEVFRIHGLIPQSLNAHLHTFTSFIHPDDRELVVQVLEKAYRQQLPVHLQYRIQLTDASVRFLSNTTNWIFNESGQFVLTGVITDLTEQAESEQILQEAQLELRLKNRILDRAETIARMGHWHLNLLTRSVNFSGQFYKIFGLKPNERILNFNELSRFVHPADRAIVDEMISKMLNEREVPDIRFNIVRPNGRMRKVHLKGELVIDASSEIIVNGALHDITEQELTTTLLSNIQDERELLQITQEHLHSATSVCSWIWDMNEDTIKASKGVNEFFALNSSLEINLDLIKRHIHPDDRTMYLQLLDKLTDGLKETKADLRILRRGETRYVRASFKVNIFKEKQVLSVIFIDVTAENMLREKVAQQEILTDKINDTSSERVCVTDTNNYILAWNSSCEQDYRIRREDAIGRNLFDVLPHFKTPELLTQVQQVLEGEPLLLQNMKTPAGLGYQDLRIIPVRDQNNKVTSILHIAKDITNDVRSKEQLASRNNFIKIFLDATNDIVLVLDRNLYFKHWNQQAQVHYQLKPDEVIGKNILEVLPHSINNPIYEYLRRALKGETVRIPVTWDPDTEGFFETSLTPLKDELGEIVSVLWISHDKTSEYGLLQKQNHSNKVIELMSEAYLLLDTSGEILYANARAGQFFAGQNEELTGKNISSIVPEISSVLQSEALVNNNRVETDIISNRLASPLHVVAAVVENGYVLLFRDAETAGNGSEKINISYAHQKQPAQAAHKSGSFSGDGGNDNRSEG